MKIKELIKKLQEFPEDLTVKINAESDYLSIKKLEIKKRTKKIGKDDIIVILTPTPR
jgi:hypothetical protein